MSTEITRARVLESLGRLRLGRIGEQLDALLSTAARGEPTYLDFLDTILREEVGAKQRKRVAMGIQIAHFPAVKTLDDFDFKFQPSVDQKLVRELAVSRYVANAENVLVFGPPGVGKTHLAIGLGRAAVEAGYTVLFTSATALLGALSKAETEGQLAERLAFYAKPKLLVVDELGYLPFEKRSAHLFFQLIAAAILDRLLHHSFTLMIQGESYRLKQKRKAGLLGRAEKAN
ncbi:IstB domain protein ATP-binding protein [Anaeromyxobacter dehalogenans 2CP-1]|uniref:IstB domain protein ATP-binding protein n=1 Tax=Anaeromyxobacter dehalogenans (strain ATCC BAA-258 / DSM 21875 / 2CP-1) TaxID=455488 RepID=B8JDP5_ANAD2|nr:ATP-binding protein [Anaeromyxobacter dehalogenans]ACL64140.1 IstB domain protein ATP-binding protein [Anaeromyxobacter dehalogenans 2CP-1]